MATSYSLGCRTVVSAMANFAPNVLANAHDVFSSGEGAGSRADLERVIFDLAAVFDQGHWISALKSTLDILGYPVGRPCSPQRSSTEAEIAEIRHILSIHSELTL